MNKIEKKAIFIHKDGTIGGAIIDIENFKDNYIEIFTYNYNMEQTGHMKVKNISHNVYYIETIYCFDRYRNNGVGRTLIEIFESLVKCDDEVRIIGIYVPYEDEYDRKIGYVRSIIELENAASNYYKTLGYKLFDIDFDTHIEKYLNKDSMTYFKEKDNILYSTKLYGVDDIKIGDMKEKIYRIV